MVGLVGRGFRDAGKVEVAPRSCLQNREGPEFQGLFSCLDHVWVYATFSADFPDFPFFSLLNLAQRAFAALLIFAFAAALIVPREACLPLEAVPFMAEIAALSAASCLASLASSRFSSATMSTESSFSGLRCPY